MVRMGCPMDCPDIGPVSGDEIDCCCSSAIVLLCIAGTKQKLSHTEDINKAEFWYVGCQLVSVHRI
jgi:hypothetical protein